MKLDFETLRTNCFISKIKAFQDIFVESIVFLTNLKVVTAKRSVASCYRTHTVCPKQQGFEMGLRSCH